jgi:Ca2+-binding RTX toxin-like protein
MQALEGRRLMAAPVLPPHTGGPPPLPPLFDTSLTAGIVVDHRVNPNTAYVLVDGSDFDDHIQVVDFRPGQSVTVQLEEWSNGVQLTNNTVTLHISGVVLQPYMIQIFGRGGNDQITNLTAAVALIDGGSGNDLIKNGSSGGATYGGDGNDTIIGGPGNDSLFGGDGDDYIRGGDGDDIIDGGRGKNLLYGDGGNDTFNAYTVEGNPDGDTIFGGAGNDTIYGGAGKDVIFGEGGDDVIYGGGGDDVINGGDGNDTIYGDMHGFARGSDGNDTIDGGAGDDVIHGQGGNDTLRGGDGNDRLFGDSGVDHLYGGNGKDYLDGGFWSFDSLNVADYLEGGAGADTFVRHKSVFGSDDLDFFADYNSAQGDSVDNVWHLYN